jgi:hypothetical protein
VDVEGEAAVMAAIGGSDPHCEGTAQHILTTYLDRHERATDGETGRGLTAVRPRCGTAESSISIMPQRIRFLDELVQMNTRSTGRSPRQCAGDGDMYGRDPRGWPPV